MSNSITHSKHTLTPLRCGDPRSRFLCESSSTILKGLPPPRRLLGTSAKIQKCEKVGVLARVLYLTPGIFCPGATRGCLETCLGHSSGRMRFQTHTRIRDTRSALFLEQPELFMKRLKAELILLETDALQYGLRPAVRLNGTSDILWERLYPDLFSDFSNLQFFDYTKLIYRASKFLIGELPRNYHLTYSFDSFGSAQAISFLRRGGNVAVVFWPHLPETWWGFPVIDGDAHDARFLDPSGVVVGLKAKGLARVDIHGLVIRPCRQCGPGAKAMELIRCEENTHRKTVHQCGVCKATITACWMLPEGGVRRRNAA